MLMASEVVHGDTDRADLNSRLALNIPAKEVRQKVTTILGKIWFPSDPGRAALASDAASYIAAGDENAKALSFTAVTIAAYPFFGQVLETVGRLIAIQGSCASGEVHRRMFERHGESRTISLSGARAFRSMIDWGLLDRDPHKRLVPKERPPAEKAGRVLLDRGANYFRGSITPLSNSDPLLLPFR